VSLSQMAMLWTSPL